MDVLNISGSGIDSVVVVTEVKRSQNKNEVWCTRQLFQNIRYRRNLSKLNLSMMTLFW